MRQRWLLTPILVRVVSPPILLAVFQDARLQGRRVTFPVLFKSNYESVPRIVRYFSARRQRSSRRATHQIDPWVVSFFRVLQHHPSAPCHKTRWSISFSFRSAGLYTSSATSGVASCSGLVGDLGDFEGDFAGDEAVRVVSPIVVLS